MVITAGKAKKGHVKNFLKKCLLKTGDTLNGMKRTNNGYQGVLSNSRDKRRNWLWRKQNLSVSRFGSFEYLVGWSGVESLFLIDTFICHIAAMDINFGISA